MICLKIVFRTVFRIKNTFDNKKPFSILYYKNKKYGILR